MINLLLVDDHTIIRTAIRRLLAEVKEFHVVSEANNGIEAIQWVSKPKQSIDIVLMDIQMPDMNGFEATRRLLEIQPQLKIIILSAFTDRIYVYDLVHIGAKGYLSKTASIDKIINAIHQVDAGECYIDASLLAELSFKTLQIKTTHSPFASLSRREQQVATLLIEGHAVGDIADSLKICANTVSTYRSRLFEKLEVKDNIALLQLAVQNGRLSNALTNDEKVDSCSKVKK